ncbi:hypothetical protein MEO93_28120 [Dolichospermum sp. ST_sed3]|nr:hypothetical protein [Dolichospermum sp. ST_sed3]
MELEKLVIFRLGIGNIKHGGFRINFELPSETHPLVRDSSVDEIIRYGLGEAINIGGLNYQRETLKDDEKYLWILKLAKTSREGTNGNYHVRINGIDRDLGSRIKEHLIEKLVAKEFRPYLLNPARPHSEVLIAEPNYFALKTSNESSGITFDGCLYPVELHLDEVFKDPREVQDYEIESYSPCLFGDIEIKRNHHE